MKETQEYLEETGNFRVWKQREQSMVPIIDDLNNKWNANNIPWIQWHFESTDYPDDSIHIDYEPQHDLEAGVNT